MIKEPRIYGSKWDRERLTFLRAHPLPGAKQGDSSNGG